MEKKSLSFELKDLDRSKRIAIIAHAAYDNIDYTNDISRKGMFTKCWNENKGDINFYLNHNDEQAPGKVEDVYEDDKFAYTKAWCGTHTLGNDVLTMMDEGIIKKASFGYATTRSNNVIIKGKKIRELKEVKHYETSVLTKMPANTMAGVRNVVKSFFDLSEIKALSQPEQTILKNIITGDQNTLEQLIRLSSGIETTSDLYTWIDYNISRRADMLADLRSQIKYNSGEIKEMQTHIKTMEKFCNDTKASDDAIKSIMQEIENTKELISEYNTAGTHADTSPEPFASIGENKFAETLSIFRKTLFT